MTRRVVRCTACSWSGRRTSAGGPCPECGAPVEETTRSVGHPPSGRVELRCRVLASTAEAITPREAAALLDQLTRLKEPPPALDRLYLGGRAVSLAEAEAIAAVACWLETRAPARR